MKHLNSRPSICLSMIVKNESHVIRRSLDSVAPFIDSWVISDTGSSDNTREIIQEFFTDKGIPGELLNNPWQDFSSNRNYSLAAARQRADYVLILDADEFLQLKSNFSFANLKHDAYQLLMRRDGISYRVNRLINSSRFWQWRGVLHEYLTLDDGKPYRVVEFNDSLVIASPPEGARSIDPKKFQRDADVLEKALEETPNDERYRFYLAQSYRDAGMLEASLKNYTIRAGMGGWQEEVYYAKLEVARLKKRLGHDKSDVINAYLEAQASLEDRLEAIFEVVSWCREQGWFELGYQLGWRYHKAHFPKQLRLFLSTTVYQWRYKDELSVCAINSGRPEKGIQLILKILPVNDIPQHERTRILANLEYAKSVVS